ncbi:MAG: diheme cytochrome c [Gammaproteobacteria bacterium]|nr:diheme cytochrome c [Gammaproteobacteria bacterium]
MKKLLLLFVLGLMLGSTAHAENGAQWLLSIDRYKGVAPVTNEVYEEECGSCHFAYPPGLLPLRSWQKLIDKQALKDHFGDNAELDDEVIAELRAYVDGNAADQVWYKTSRKFNQSLKSGETPSRITKTEFFQWRHEEVPKKYFDQAKVKSPSFCDKCHQEAKFGVFEEDTVMIPEYGYWTW